MDNHFLRQTALAQLGLSGRKPAQAEEAGVTMTEVPFRAIVNLRGKAEDKAFMAGTKIALGNALPKTPNSALPGEGLTVLFIYTRPEVVAPEDCHHTACFIEDPSHVDPCGNPLGTVEIPIDHAQRKFDDLVQLVRSERRASTAEGVGTL